MARVYKKPLYRPVPEGAHIIHDKKGTKYAYWIERGEQCTALYVESKNGPRIVEESEFYIARYTDATGRFRERSTGCRELRAAEHKLSVWLQEIEKVKAGILTQEEFEIGKRVQDTIENQLVFFKEHLIAKGATECYIEETLTRIRKICDGCKFKRMIDMNSNPFLRWLNQKACENMGAKTRNKYRESMITFSNWAVRNDVLAANPFARVPKAKESSDRRHVRRALTSEEIIKLLDAAEARPLVEVSLIRRGANKGKPLADIREGVKEDAKRLGKERKLIYATLIYTGLRKNELASITLGQVFLDHEIPHIVLNARDEKSRRGATLPLHPVLVSQLREWIHVKLSGDIDPRQEKLFAVPTGIHRTLDRDLKFAGVEKRDTLDRVIDVHALRHTHATLLAREGVSPSVAQSAMRHSDIRMTMGVYTHLELGDIEKGIKTIPNFFGEKNDNN